MWFRCAFVVFGAVTFGQRLADLTELIERKPDFAAAYYARGITHLQAKQYQLAGLDLNRTIELTPGDATVYAGRAQLYTETKQWDAAIADLTTAISLKPRPTFYLRRAETYRIKGDCAHAVADYSEILPMWPTVEALHGRAECRKQLGDAAGAAEDERKIEGVNARINGSQNSAPPAAIPPTVPASPTSSGGGGRLPAPAPYMPNVFRIGGGVSQPSLLFKVEPEYSEEARKAKWQGMVSLSIVIDEFGQPQNLIVIRGLGLGLDEEAIDAVRRWVLKPGRKDGTPVAVYANVEVTFHLL